ncbi:type III pantothenate kinase [Bacteroidota bacterium]
MILTVDIGNSRIKWARFDNRKVFESGMMAHGDFNGIKALLTYYQNDSICISSVVALDDGVNAFCKSVGAFMVDNKSKTPLINKYQTPETLGMDRICAAVGAKSHFPEHPILSIDIGTCVKYEFISKEGEYLGGNISPGLQMRFSALNQYTSKLPKLAPSAIKGPIGRSTSEALQLGVQQGILFEMDAMIETMKALHPELKIVATGGDLPFFVNELKTHIFADLLLVLRGINEIYLHNT